MGNNSNLYKLDGKVPLMQAIPFGLQHVLAMFVANITPIIILANVVGIAPTVSAALIQNCMIIAGIGTLVQLYPIWRIGSRLPIVMGISFTFLSVSLTIGTSTGYGCADGGCYHRRSLRGTFGTVCQVLDQAHPSYRSCYRGDGNRLLPAADRCQLLRRRTGCR